jgi:hypothetical protein
MECCKNSATKFGEQKLVCNLKKCPAKGWS